MTAAPSERPGLAGRTDARQHVGTVGELLSPAVLDHVAGLVAIAQAEPASTTRGPTKTLRFPVGSDTKEWIETWAAAHDLSANGAILLAINTLRAAVTRGGAEGTTTP